MLLLFLAVQIRFVNLCDTEARFRNTVTRDEEWTQPESRGDLYLKKKLTERELRDEASVATKEVEILFLTIVVWLTR